MIPFIPRYDDLPAMPRTIVEPRKLPFISGPGDCAHLENSVGDVGIYHGSSGVDMAEQLLNGSELLHI